ncbi:hypothetical protein K1J10_10350, partial [Streptococcus australis]|uniref:hypothetical protein n=1 Tax=Streptococcus australis TaxID=113107 RepID=UPI001CBC522B
YAVFRNSSISDERIFCVALHFTTGLNENLIQSNLNNVSSKNVLRIYIFQSDLYKSKIKEVIRMFST